MHPVHDRLDVPALDNLFEVAGRKVGLCAHQLTAVGNHGADRIGTVSEGVGWTGGPSGSLSVQPKIASSRVATTIALLEQTRHRWHLIATPD